MDWLCENKTGCRLTVRLTPRAAANRIRGIHNGALKIQVTAPPVNGRANAALIQFLSKTLRTSRGQIEILRGGTARIKTVQIAGLSRSALQQRIGIHPPDRDSPSRSV